MASKAARTRAFIIEKTSPIFNQKGVAGTSLSDITEATGLTKGAIYGNFQDKDEVAVAAFEHNVKLVFDALAVKLSKETTAPGRLKAIIDFYRQRYAAQGFNFGCPMANTATEADDTHPLLHAKVREQYLKWRKGIIKIVRAGMDAGELNMEMDAEAFAHTMVSTIQGSVVVFKATGEKDFLLQPLAMLDRLVDQQTIR